MTHRQELIIKHRVGDEVTTVKLEKDLIITDHTFYEWLASAFASLGFYSVECDIKKDILQLPPKDL